jgi:hypothetical protein
MQKSQASTARRWLFWVAVSAAITIVVVVLGADIARRSMSMTLPAQAGTTPAKPIPGGYAKEVVQIVRAPASGRFDAVVLAASARDAQSGQSGHDGNTNYQLTDRHLTFEETAKTTIVMGSASDLKLGAVAQVSGDFDDKLVIQARQIVILTGVVHVTQGQR